MSPLWLYAFTRPDARPEAGLAGIGGAPVDTVDEARIRAWCSETVAVAPGDRVRAVAAHHRVVESAWRAASACVPARFGQRLADAEALRAEVAARAGSLEPALDAVAGCVEMGVRIFSTGAAPASGEEETERPDGPEDAASGAGPGRAYLLARARVARSARAREARAHALAKEVGEAVVPFLRQSRVNVPPHGSGDVALAHLVSGGSLAAYRSAVHDWAHARSGVRVVVEGPWPPYSFAAVDEGGGPT